MILVSDKGAALGDSDGSKDSSLESNEFRGYGRGDPAYTLKEVFYFDVFVVVCSIV